LRISQAPAARNVYSSGKKKLASSGGATYQHAYAAPLFVSERLYTYRPSGADPQNPAGLGNLRFEI
jgi:hypothetical protein